MKIGILGGGQLGQMLILAGYPLGLRFRVFDPDPKAVCHDLAEHVQGSFDDLEALQRFAQGLDVITYEFENIDPQHLHALQKTAPLYPSVKALETSQDRLQEKRFFRSIGARTSPFQAIDSLADLHAAAAAFAYPCILKTRRFGYDGKGQAVIRSAADIEQAWRSCGEKNLILEGFVAFNRELSLIAVRDRQGRMDFYPLVENHHVDGILRTSIAPSPQRLAQHETEAQAIATAAMQALDYVGLLAIEFFAVADGLVVNEMAPRVHNSGHWTIEGAITSQFENHLRAITGLSIGRCAAIKPTLMVNMIGEQPDLGKLLASAPTGVHAHYYGKTPRPGRKLGHLTYLADDYAALQECLNIVRTIK